MSTKQIRIYGKSLAAIVKKANAMDAKDLPTYPRKRRTPVSPTVPERIRAIKTWRDQLADRLDIDPTLLFNKALMTAIAVTSLRISRVCERSRVSATAGGGLWRGGPENLIRPALKPYHRR